MLLQTNDTMYWGLWLTIDQADNMLKPMKEQVRALKALRLRKNILQKSSSVMFSLFPHPKVEERKEILPLK